MIPILTDREVELMRKAGRAASDTLVAVEDILRPGCSTFEVEQLVRELTRQQGGKPSQEGTPGHDGAPPFPAAVCTSPNQVVCHGIPSKDVALQDGDILNVDVTTELNGFHGDTSRTFIIGAASEEATALVALAKECLELGLGAVRPGARLGDIGAAISERALAGGCSVVRDFGGHGIGRRMHQAPHVPHWGKRGSGLRLKPGMAFTIEPMLNLGAPEVQVLADGWTVVTADASLSAQFEHTVLVTRDGHEVLTRPVAT